MTFDDDEEHRVKRILDTEPRDDCSGDVNCGDVLEDASENVFESENKPDNKDETDAISKGYKEDEYSASSLEKDDIKQAKSAFTDNAEDSSEGERFIPPSEALKAEKDALTHTNTSKNTTGQMGILDHLSEMRRRLTRIVIIIIIGFFAFYGVSELAYSYLALPLTSLLPEGSTLIYTSPQGAFFTYLKVAFMLSILGTSPFTFYQIWAFVAPGLYKEEQRAIAPLAFFSAFFFIGGAAFCYFLVFPIAFKFFLGFTSDIIVPMISVEEYLSFALKLIIAFGLVFEMPLFSYFLSKMRIITPEGMRRYRKYAMLMMFILAAILTPPDVFSQILMAMPMIFLYEVSIYVAKVARGVRDKNEKTEQESSDDTAEAQMFAANLGKPYAHNETQNTTLKDEKGNEKDNDDDINDKINTFK